MLTNHIYSKSSAVNMRNLPLMSNRLFPSMLNNLTGKCRSKKKHFKNTLWKKKLICYLAEKKCHYPSLFHKHLTWTWWYLYKFQSMSPQDTYTDYQVSPNRKPLSPLYYNITWTLAFLIMSPNKYCEFRT